MSFSFPEQLQKFRSTSKADGHKVRDTDMISKYDHWYSKKYKSFQIEELTRVTKEWSENKTSGQLSRENSPESMNARLVIHVCHTGVELYVLYLVGNKPGILPLQYSWL